MQNAIIAALQEVPDMAYGELYLALFGPQPTESQLASARRALTALQRKRLVITRAFATNHYGRSFGGMSVQLVPHSPEEEREFAERVEKHRAEASRARPCSAGSANRSDCPLTASAGAGQSPRRATEVRAAGPGCGGAAGCRV
jgi:hypothetical protein